MDPKQFHRRTALSLALLFVILAAFLWVLYGLQIIHGEDYLAQSQRKIAATETVEAARGEILDRYGRVLVSNRISYQVTLDTSRMGTPEERNATLLKLISISRAQGVEWSDSLPITASAPFIYTTNDVFSYAYTDEDGKAATGQTQLGKLTGMMDGWSEEDSADALLQHMKESWELSDDLSDEDSRSLCGLLYELWLRRKGVTWSTYVFAKDVDIAFITAVKEAGLSGVSIDPVTVREYNTKYAAHLLGRVGPIYANEWEHYKNLDTDGDGEGDYDMDDTVGKDGVELAFESYLRGTPGTRAVETDTSGKVVSETWLTDSETGESLAPQPGGNVILTLDIELQAAVEESLAARVPNLSEGRAEGAAVVVLDPNTSEVLASASYPTFNLSTYSADFNELSKDPLNPYLNRALSGIYAPGSTFKMVTAVAGLEEGIIEPSTEILDTGRYTYYKDYQPQCWYFRQYHRTHGLENVSEAIRDSCNVFFYDVGRRVGIDRLNAYASHFGLGESTGIELPEKTGTLAGPNYTENVLGQKWNEGSTLPAAIGQENNQFTPLQLANYVATLVNGGTRHSVHLLRAVKSYDYSETLVSYEREVLDTLDIEQENLDAVKYGMYMVANDSTSSTSKYFRNLGVEVGAKTGSAQVTGNEDSNAVFVCFAPYDDPEVVISIVVEKGGSGSELGAIATDILSAYFSSNHTDSGVLQENTLLP